MNHTTRGRRILSLFALAVFATFIVQCKGKKQAEQGKENATRYAKASAWVIDYKLQIVKDKKGNPKEKLKTVKSYYVIPAEPLTLLKMNETDKKIAKLLSGKKAEELLYVKVMLGDGKSKGFIKKSLLALQPIMITEDGVKTYKRPGSAMYAKLPAGQLCMILEINKEKNMLNVYCGKVNYKGTEKWVTHHWMEATGYSVQPEDIEAAKEIHLAGIRLAKLEEKNELDSEKAQEIVTNLRDYVDQGGPAGLAAERLLTKYGFIEEATEDTSEEEEYTSPTDEQTTTQETTTNSDNSETVDDGTDQNP
ncbi:MAG: hypothetical protein D6767_03910 [Candidatus Hydrogenedentota bacterium]|nr:MAG: hypothetical protein D6767_03910 [Candidatus Hydrogenedentota bacterium]